ncbi:U4/U6 small nuclear ribonucleoprotein Prp31-like [Xenia sp. Carnegie-2017]|uniref:U4/U6 small nuclear ribonucleoprotein Prp31-like n=1 Tax=Xenia sp. Carnegie-2017 TaxID=2897299 RepID=UPI001F03BCF5|nr:U4/U6 small nuclear ribonucleoprotein Prp31-like [Xenia sp. Carnegie-2017]
MSLADELLADLEEIGDEGNVDIIDNDNIEEAMETSDSLDTKSVKHIAKLRDGKQLQDVLEKIKEFSEKPRGEMFGPIETDPEYQLIVEANNLTVEIDNEISIIHKYTRDQYAKRFPELESLVPSALDYIKTVQLLDNDLEVSNVDLTEILPPATKMVVSVTASTTQGERLENDELERVMEACQMALDLVEAKARIFEYVESQMSFIAPNTSWIVGATAAAKLMGSAGGLTSLSKMPACNVLLLGAQRKTLTGFSSAAILPHTGHIYYCDLVQSLPQDLRKKGARIVAAKCTLAARVDSFHENVDGSIGRNFFEDIEHKFRKWQEPPPLKEAKPLPRPDDAPKKKRGGRRVRKMKEKSAITELRRQANRVQFGKIEEDMFQTDMGFSVGAQTKGSGKVRAAADKKTQVSISKRLQRNLQQGQATYGGKSTVRGQTSGTASSVAFTPLQGLEIVNPHAAEKRVADANAKYFSSTSGFLHAKKKGTGTK